MSKRYIIVTLVTLLSSIQADASINWGTVWCKLHNLTNLFKGDIVSCKASAHSFQVAARSRSLTDDSSSNYPSDQLLKKHYANKAKIAGEKTRQEFYGCMADLQSPKDAVRSGEYKKCIAQAWEHRPWLTPTTIDIRAHKAPENSNGWEMFFAKYGRFERDLPSSFLE